MFTLHCIMLIVFLLFGQCSISLFNHFNLLLLLKATHLLGFKKFVRVYNVLFLCGLFNKLRPHITKIVFSAENDLSLNFLSFVSRLDLFHLFTTSPWSQLDY